MGHSRRRRSTPIPKIIIVCIRLAAFPAPPLRNDAMLVINGTIHSALGCITLLIPEYPRLKEWVSGSEMAAIFQTRTMRNQKAFGNHMRMVAAKMPITIPILSRISNSENCNFIIAECVLRALK